MSHRQSNRLKDHQSLLARFREQLAKDPSVTAADFLREHPSIESQVELAVEAIYDEYLKRRGEQGFDESAFVQKYSQYRSKLERLLSVHVALSDPEVAERFQLASWPLEGETHGKFKLVDCIGRGAFSSVFLAKQSNVGDRSVVVKFTAAASSQAEVRALSKLRHSNIIPLFTVESFEELGLDAVCMPYCGRLTLLDLIRVFRSESSNDRATSTSQLPARLILSSAAEAVFGRHLDDEASLADELPDWSGVEEKSYARFALEAGLSVLNALAAAHKAGVWHCDIKPSNILVDDEAEAQLFDFNLSIANGEGKRGGTLPYMAPEQLLGFQEEESTTELDDRTDLFGWAVTLYQTLTGRLPFQVDIDDESNESDQQVAAGRQMAYQKVGLPEHDPLKAIVPSDIQKLIVSCLAFDPDERPKSANACHEELERLLDSYDEFMEPVKIERPLVKRRVLLTVAATSIIAVAAGGANFGLRLGNRNGRSDTFRSPSTGDPENGLRGSQEQIDSAWLDFHRKPYEETTSANEHFAATINSAYRFARQLDFGRAASSIHGLQEDPTYQHPLADYEDLAYFASLSHLSADSNRQLPKARPIYSSWNTYNRPLMSPRQLQVPIANRLCTTVIGYELISEQLMPLEIGDRSYTILLRYCDSGCDDRALDHVKSRLAVRRFLAQRREYLYQCRKFGCVKSNELELSRKHANQLHVSNVCYPDGYLDKSLVYFLSAWFEERQDIRLHYLQRCDDALKDAHRWLNGSQSSYFHQRVDLLRKIRWSSAHQDGLAESEINAFVAMFDSVQRTNSNMMRPSARFESYLLSHSVLLPIAD